jgi:hypothetical protein
MEPHDQKHRIGKIKRGKKWGWLVVLVVVAIALIFGYFKVYKPRMQAKNYASYSALTVFGIETKLQAFDAAERDARVKIFESLPRLWDDFCTVECPDNPRAEEIQWKMAKLFEYTRTFMEQELAEKYVGSEKADSLRVIQERIRDLKWLMDDTTAYGNFKRIK